MTVHGARRATQTPHAPVERIPATHRCDMRRVLDAGNRGPVSGPRKVALPE